MVVVVREGAGIASLTLALTEELARDMREVFSLLVSETPASGPATQLTLSSGRASGALEIIATTGSAPVAVTLTLVLAGVLSLGAGDGPAIAMVASGTVLG